MALDEPNQDEIVTDEEGVVIMIDDSSQSVLGEQVTMDYTSFGFKLTTPNEILSYNLHMEKGRTG